MVRAWCCASLSILRLATVSLTRPAAQVTSLQDRVAPDSECSEPLEASPPELWDTHQPGESSRQGWRCEVARRLVESTAIVKSRVGQRGIRTCRYRRFLPHHFLESEAAMRRMLEFARAVLVASSVPAVVLFYLSSSRAWIFMLVYIVA